MKTVFVCKPMEQGKSVAVGVKKRNVWRVLKIA
jgi:hypothetical protein